MVNYKVLARRSIAVLLLLTLVLAVGCSAARKPEQQPQEKVIVVPETTKLAYDKVDPDKAPDIIKAMLRQREKGQSSLWAMEGRYAYIALLRENGDGEPSLNEVVEHYGGEENSWLNVKLNDDEEKDIKDKQEGSVFLVRVLPRQAPRGIIFSSAEDTAEEEKEETTPPAAAKPAPTPAPSAQKKPLPQAVPQTDSTASAIESPKPNEEITSPVVITGRISNTPGNFRLRIITGTGIVLKEEGVNFTEPPRGNFKNSVSYTSPPVPRPGYIEIINSTGARGDVTLLEIPVLIK